MYHFCHRGATFRFISALPGLCNRAIFGLIVIGLSVLIIALCDANSGITPRPGKSRKNFFGARETNGLRPAEAIRSVQSSNHEDGATKLPNPCVIPVFAG